MHRVTARIAAELALGTGDHGVSWIRGLRQHSWLKGETTPSTCLGDTGMASGSLTHPHTSLPDLQRAGLPVARDSHMALSLSLGLRNADSAQGRWGDCHPHSHTPQRGSRGQITTPELPPPSLITPTGRPGPLRLVHGEGGGRLKLMTPASHPGPQEVSPQPLGAHPCLARYRMRSCWAMSRMPSCRCRVTVRSSTSPPATSLRTISRNRRTSM